MKQNVTPTQQCSSHLLTRICDLNGMVYGLNAACNINKDVLIWFGKYEPRQYENRIENFESISFESIFFLIYRHFSGQEFSAY